MAALTALGVALPVVGAAAAVINTGLYVVDADTVVVEDVYVAASSATVEGRIEGDLVIAAGSLRISGTVTGDVLVAVRGPVEVSGTVEGSLRGVARSVAVTGVVGADVAVAALGLDLSGEVARDVVAFGVTGDVGGTVGRDVLGRYLRLAVGAVVGNDVDVTVRSLRIAAGAKVGGDVVYQADRSVATDAGAAIEGQVIQIPAGAPFPVRVLLDLALLLGFLGYLTGGLILLWLLRRSAGNAVAVVAERPWRAVGVGVAVGIGGPIIAVLLVATIVGIPLAIVGVLALATLLLFGTVPLVTAVGLRLLSGRGGPPAGFLLGAVLWRVVALVLPLLGAVLFVVALVWGSGGWAMGAWRARTLAAPPAPGTTG